MIVYHFILNLRQFGSADSSWISDNQSHTLRFVRNSMGQSLQSGVEDEDGEEVVPGVEADVSQCQPEISIEPGDEAEVDEEHVGRSYATEQVSSYSDCRVLYRSSL